MTLSLDLDSGYTHVLPGENPLDPALGPTERHTQ